MATTFKTFLNDDRASTRTLLHEAIPVTGSLIYGTYPEPGLTNSNIKLYTHGMFQSVYDYTYTKSSANHIFDLTVGYSSESVSAGLVVTADTYKTKKQMIYNEFAKILVGHDVNGAIRQFDEDGKLDAGDKYKECFVISIARLLNKDEVKKGSFYMDIDVTGVVPPATCSIGGGDGAAPATASLTFASALSADNEVEIKDLAGNEITFIFKDSSVVVDGSVDSSGYVIVGSNASGMGSTVEQATALFTAINNVTDYDQSANAGSSTNYVLNVTATNGTASKVDLTQDSAGSTGNGLTLTAPEGTASTPIVTIVDFAGGTNGTRSELRISDTGAGTEFRTNSPTGEYGILKCDTYKVFPMEADCTDGGATCTITYEDNEDAALLKSGSNTKDLDRNVGLIFYQAGVVVLSPYMFERYLNTDTTGGYAAGEGTASTPTGTNDGKLPIGHGTAPCNVARPLMDASNRHIDALLNSQSLDDCGTAFRKRINKMAFNNTTELNSTIYFCRANHNDFNYSSNPTYTGPDSSGLTGSSKIRVKENQTDAPVAYITTVGLYSADNELLAVAKLSEPLRKDPTNEMVLRVRLDY